MAHIDKALQLIDGHTFTQRISGLVQVRFDGPTAPNVKRPQAAFNATMSFIPDLSSSKVLRARRAATSAFALALLSLPVPLYQGH